MSRQLRHDSDALNRTVDLACKAPDAIPFIGDNRPFFGVIPPHHIHKAGFDAGSAAGAFIHINFNAGAHVLLQTLKRFIQGPAKFRIDFRKQHAKIAEFLHIVPGKPLNRDDRNRNARRQDKFRFSLRQTIAHPEARAMLEAVWNFPEDIAHQ